MTRQITQSRLIAVAVLLACAWNAAAAQAMDPASVIAKEARTHVAAGRPAPRKSGAQPRRAGHLLPTAELPTDVVKREAQPASTPVVSAPPEVSAPASTSSTSILLMTVAVIAALAGTGVFLAFASRPLQQRLSRRTLRPSIIAPIPFEVQPLPSGRPDRVAEELDEPAPGVESAIRYQRGRGEMELAMAIERLKHDLPRVPKSSRAAGIPKTRSGRIAAARKQGVGSGEMDLALRLEKLRAASMKTEDQA